MIIMKFKRIEELFNRIAGTLRERGETHGDFNESWDEIARRWSYILGVDVTAKKALLCMAEMKRVRLVKNLAHEDNYIDDIGYVALAWNTKKSFSEMEA